MHRKIWVIGKVAPRINHCLQQPDVNTKINFGTPPWEYNTEAEAKTEAERLARQHPGFEFLVFEAMSSSNVNTDITTRL